jgi:predicted thioesterase
VEAFDEAGRIGEGTHERFIVENARFLKKTYEKTQKQ